ncbi:hypothetical protein D9M69_623160 [compost metagenome]
MEIDGDAVFLRRGRVWNDAVFAVFLTAGIGARIDILQRNIDARILSGLGLYRL